jgi:aryl-alcohol dehydrogenase-like predicted oxidoreductase
MRSQHDERWQPGNFERNKAAVDRLSQLAAQKGITVSQLALAWLLAQGQDIVPIPGTRNLDRVRENAGAADVTLTEDDLAAIHDALPNGSFGNRYPEAMRYNGLSRAR